MKYLEYTTTKEPSIARQNILFAVTMGMITPAAAARMMRELDKVPRFRLKLRSHRP